MKKILLQFIVLAALFLSTWALLNRVDFMGHLQIHERTATLEENLGKLLYEYIIKNEEEITDKTILDSLIHIKNRIGKNSGMDPADIKLHLIKRDEVNAFTLPDNYLVLYSGLLQYCQSAEEIAGVMGHEIAHMERNHVMRKLGKEIGLSVLISMTSGGGAQTANEIVRLLSSMAYDRNLEREADRYSVQYMLDAGIDPAPFADFMYRLSLERESGLPRVLFRLTTHPDSEERARDILEFIGDKETDSHSLFKDGDWELFQNILSNL